MVLFIPYLLTAYILQSKSFSSYSTVHGAPNTLYTIYLQITIIQYTNTHYYTLLLLLLYIIIIYTFIYRKITNIISRLNPFKSADIIQI